MLFVFTSATITSEKNVVFFFIVSCLSYVYMHVYDMYMAASLHVNVAKPPTVLLLVDKVSTL